MSGKLYTNKCINLYEIFIVSNMYLTKSEI